MDAGGASLIDAKNGTDAKGGELETEWGTRKYPKLALPTSPQNFGPVFALSLFHRRLPSQNVNWRERDSVKRNQPAWGPGAKPVSCGHIAFQIAKSTAWFGPPNATYRESDFAGLGSVTVSDFP
jgi:hypothetical protein